MSKLTKEERREAAAKGAKDALTAVAAVYAVERAAEVMGCQPGAVCQHESVLTACGNGSYCKFCGETLA